MKNVIKEDRQETSRFENRISGRAKQKQTSQVVNSTEGKNSE